MLNNLRLQPKTRWHSSQGPLTPDYLPKRNNMHGQNAQYKYNLKECKNYYNWVDCILPTQGNKPNIRTKGDEVD